MDSFVNRMLQLLLNEELIQFEEKDIYEYGLHIFFLKIIHVASILFFSIVFKNTIEILIFMTCYMVLRKYTGGYHAHTSISCLAISILMVFVIYYSNNFMIFLVQLPIVIMSVMVICILSPIISINNPFDHEQIQHNRKYSIFLSILFFIFWVLAVIFGLPIFSTAITYSLLFCSFFLLVAQFQSIGYLHYMKRKQMIFSIKEK